MCKNEAYGISKLGYIEDLDKIDKTVLLNHYKNLGSEMFKVLIKGIKLVIGRYSIPIQVHCLHHAIATCDS